MDTGHRLLPRLASSVASGDVEAAAAMFGADGRITIHDGQHAAVTVPARVGLAAAVAAFSEIAYTPVLHLDGDGFTDDGVLTGSHRSAFLDCPPTGRRVYLNVHLSGQVAEDGLLAELTVGTSLASLRHQLRGGGDTLAVADGLTAEVRHRMWAPRPESDESRSLVGPGTAAQASDTTGADPRGRPARRK